MDAALDNSDPPDNDVALAPLDFTNQQLWIALDSNNCDFSRFRGDGRDFQAYDADGTTPLVTSLRTWKAGTVALRLHSRLPVSVSPSPDYGNYVHAYGIRSGDLGFANPPHTVCTEATHAGRLDGKQEGRMRCMDKDGASIWTWTAPGNDCINHFELADLDGDGVLDTILAGTHRISRSVYALNLTNPPTIRWTYAISTQGNSYIRACATGNLRHDLAGNEVVISGSEGLDSNSNGAAHGKIAALDKDGNQLWIANQDPAPANHTTQDCILADLLNTGQLDVFAGQAQHIYKYDFQGNFRWSTTHDGNRNYYAIAAGFLTSKATRVVVGVAGIAVNTEYVGIITCVDDAGAVLWDKPLPFHGYGVRCADLDGDGYDEILVATGTAAGGATGTTFGPPEQGWGCIFILDRFGNEISAFQQSNPTKDIVLGNFDGTGAVQLQGSGDEGRFSRWYVDSGVTTATVKVIVPSVAWKSTRTLHFGPSGSVTIPPKGDRYFDFSGADGSSPSNYTQQIGVWTMQGGRIASPDDGDTATAATLEVTGVSIEAFEWEHSAYKPAMGNPISYNGGRYRCTNWSGGRPDGYAFQHGNTGTVTLSRTASGSGTAVYTLFNAPVAGATFTTSDKVSYRVVVFGHWHALYYRKNDAAGWLELYNLQDTNAGKTMAAGSIAFMSQRGQSRFSESALWTFRNQDGNSGLGPVPLLYSTFVPAVIPPGTPPASGLGARLLENGYGLLLEDGENQLLEASLLAPPTPTPTPGTDRLLENGAIRLLESGALRQMEAPAAVPTTGYERLLEGGAIRLLESGGYRQMEGAPYVPAVQSGRLLESGFGRLLESGYSRLMEGSGPNRLLPYAVVSVIREGPPASPAFTHDFLSTSR